MANIIVFGPHPDDQELGMGGTIAKLAERGHRVLLCDMTDGEPTPYGDPRTRAEEARAAALILSPKPGAGGEGGVLDDPKPIKRVLLDMPNRYVEHTIENRHKVAGLIRAHQADILFVPFFEDAHPDHRAVTRIVEDARFDAKLTKVDMPVPPGFDRIGDPKYPKWIFYYYCTHLRWVADPTFVVDISGYEDRKRRAIEAYHTQFVLPEKNRKVVDWVDAAGKYIGSRIGVAAGEPFYTKEPLGLSNFASLSL